MYNFVIMNFSYHPNSSHSFGLNYVDRPKDQKIFQISLSSEHDDDQHFPSLTLSLSLDQPSSKVDVESKCVVLEQQASSVSEVSSLSNPKIMKRQRDVTCTSIQELEARKKYVVDDNDDEDEDEDESGARKKLKLDQHQALILEESFNEHSILNLKQKQALARRLNLRPLQVEVWFQNRRARKKLKRTEIECEVLKKNFERLKDENIRLQREVQQLKSKKRNEMPFFDMQLRPPAKLTTCPFCNTRIISSSSRDISAKSLV